MGLFRRKKNAKKEEQEKLEAINTNTVLIRVFRKVGEDLYAQAAEFEATEKPDSNTNLYAINEDKNFKEELNFSKDRIFDILANNLNIVGKEYKIQERILRERIKAQEALIKKFDSEDKEEVEKINTNNNFRDEELKLRQLRILYDSLKYQKLGGYLRLGKNGIRVYEFESRDGVLYPFVFGGTKSPRAHPDFTVKKKIFNHENTIFNQQFGVNLNKVMTWMAIIFIGICMVWSLGNGFWTYKNWVTDNEIDMRVNAAGITCNNALATLTNSFGTAIKDYSTIKQDVETLKKNQDNNINSKNNLVIEPNQK